MGRRLGTRWSSGLDSWRHEGSKTCFTVCARSLKKKKNPSSLLFLWLALFSDPIQVGNKDRKTLDQGGDNFTSGGGGLVLLRVLFRKKINTSVHFKVQCVIFWLIYDFYICRSLIYSFNTLLCDDLRRGIREAKTAYKRKWRITNYRGCAVTSGDPDAWLAEELNSFLARFESPTQLPATLLQAPPASSTPPLTVEVQGVTRVLRSVTELNEGNRSRWSTWCWRPAL